MNLLVNNQNAQDLIGQNDTLSAVLQNVQENCVASQEVITSVLIDDQALTAQQLSEWQKRPADEFGEIHVTVESRNTFASRGLREMATELTHAGQYRAQMVDYIADGNSTEAMTILGDYMQTWHTTQQALNSVCRLMDTDPSSLQIFNSNSPKKQKPVADYINLLSEQLNKVKSALDAKDMVLLGDILEYEIEEVSDSWQNLLLQLAEKFENENHSAD